MRVLPVLRFNSDRAFPILQSVHLQLPVIRTGGADDSLVSPLWLIVSYHGKKSMGAGGQVYML